MANHYTEQRLVDSNKRTVIKISGNLDGTQVSNLVVVDTSTLAYAMNANNQIMVSNTHPKSAYRVDVVRVYGDVNVTGVLQLRWDGDSNTSFLNLGSSPAIPFEDSYAVTIPNNEANTNGDILLTTIGAVANDSYTLFIELEKNAEDYSMGQHDDPAAFNYGEFGIV